MLVFSSLAVKGVLDLVTANSLHGQELQLRFDPTALIVRRLRDGEAGDVAILTAAGVDEMISAGVLEGPRVDLAVSEVGLAVKDGAEKPDITTVGAVRAALLAAESIAYSKAGASGLFFARVLEQLGIADEVNSKATIIPSGFTAELLLDGRAALAVQQISELSAVGGVDIVGPLPDDIQERLTFSAAVFAGSSNKRLADEFLRFLRSSAVAAIYRQNGLVPA